MSRDDHFDEFDSFFHPYDDEIQGEYIYKLFPTPIHTETTKDTPSSSQSIPLPVDTKTIQEVESHQYEEVSQPLSPQRNPLIVRQPPLRL